MPASFRLTLASQGVQLVHVEMLNVALTGQNASSTARCYRIDVSGIPDDWYDLDKPAVAALARC